MSTKESGVIIGAISYEKNVYDSHTLDQAIEQQQRLTEIQLEEIYADRGYRGVKEVRGTKITIPGNKTTDTVKEKIKLRKGFRRRASIEPIIGHLKSDYRLSRNYYKGIVGDQINVLLAAAAWNFKRMVNKWRNSPLIDFFIQLYYSLLSWTKAISISKKIAIS